VLAAPALAGPRLDYTLNCMGCHGVDGAGAPPEIPQLRDRIGYYLDVDGGRSYLVQVPGSRQSALSDAALADVLNWMLERFAGASMPAGVQPYSEAEVSRLRAEPVNDIAAVRRDLERAIATAHPTGYRD
jgi:mono/diheme cytochrome c family protein